MPDGPFPTRIGLPTTWPPFVRGSIRATVPASVSATQTNPPPTVSADGSPGVGIVCCTVFVAGLIRDTAPRSDIATQIDPAPAAIASGEADSGIAAKMCPVDAETAPTAFPPSVPSSCVACDPPLENANSGTATAAAITPASAATSDRPATNRGRRSRVAPRRGGNALGAPSGDCASLGLDGFDRRLDDRRPQEPAPPGAGGRSSRSPATDTRRAPPRAAAGTARTPERLGAVSRGRVCLHQTAVSSLAKRRERDQSARPTLPPLARRRDAGTHRQGRSARGRGCRRARAASARPTLRPHRAGTAGAPVTPPTQPPPVPGRARLRRALLPRPVRRSAAANRSTHVPSGRSSR